MKKIGGIIGSAAIGFFVCYILGAIFPPFIEKGQSFFNVTILGKKACWEAYDPIPINMFANQMKSLIDNEWIITISPDAENIHIAEGKYDCQKAYIEVIQTVLDKNHGNINYDIDQDDKTIHIYRISHKE